ncbi:hypothetical protein [Guptibacillus spartinae]|uniref:hypothetical protein n=1 Tax=Guptibacillus spartinae TaxID=3025679 RepID=UPI00235F219C|nr:hypothetical protein [Pseudalkalibacillus spartinae]
MFKEAILEEKQYHENEIAHEELLLLVNKKLEFETENLTYLWSPVIYQFLFDDEKIFWEKDIIQISYNKICEIYDTAE